MSSSTKSKLHAFERRDTSYETSDDFSIGISVFVPKGVKEGCVLPVHVRWHGGALINGFRAYEPWLPGWIIDLAASHNAIVIMPDYRLLPESPGTDILKDMHAFYSWLHNKFPSFLSTFSPNTRLDLSSVLVTGESAGGYMAVQSSLLANIPGLKAVIAHYPMLDLRSDWYGKPGRKCLFGQPPPEYPEDWVDEQLELAKKSGPITERIPNPYELDLFNVLLQTGRYTEVLGPEDVLFPMENLDLVNAKGGNLTPTWIIHGDADSAIPIDGTWEFVEKTKRVFGEEDSERLKVTVVEGMEHGFDNEGSSLDDQWVTEGLPWLSKHWP